MSRHGIALRIAGVLLVAQWALIVHAAQPAQPPVDAALLGFELDPLSGVPGGWAGFPAGTVFTDEKGVQQGKRTLRIERDVASPQEFSTILRSLPIDFKGKDLELRGWLRKEGSGVPSFWVRLDGADSMLSFHDMADATEVNAEWKPFSLSMPLSPGALSLVMGVRFTGTGKAWADGLELLVDGKPFADRERVVHAPTIFETDRQFEKGSGIALDKPTTKQLEVLALTGKVWGFLKYHHPAVTAGKIHWDNELLRHLPALLAARDAAAARRLLVEWVDALGPVAECKDCATLDPENLQIAPRLKWLDDQKMLGADLSARLKAIYRARVPGQQHFVGLARGVGNPSFDAESSYRQVKFPDPGFQLLTIYRFWNAIEYWFPNRDLIDENWDHVLRDTLSRASSSMESERFQREIMAFVARVDDGHASLWSAWKLREPVGECQLPVSLRFIEQKFVVEALLTDDEAARLFKPGDVLTSLDGVTVEEIVKNVRRYYGASNESWRMREIANNISRGKCGAVRVGVKRDRAQTLDAQRVAFGAAPPKATYANDRTGDTFQMLSPEVAYLKLSSIKRAEVAGYIEKAKDAKSLIVDIRNYPSEFVVFEQGQLLVDAPTQFVTFSRADLSNPGAFHFETTPVVLKPTQPHFAGNVAILVDESSISQAEYTAMALRASPRARIFGLQTAGADGNVSRIPLPGNHGTGISGLGVFYPDRSPTQQLGVKLDVVCPNTIKGLRERRDETLDCALRELAKAR